MCRRRANCDHLPKERAIGVLKGPEVASVRVPVHAVGISKFVFGLLTLIAWAVSACNEVGGPLTGSQVAFIVEPSDSRAGEAISPAVKVAIKDVLGNVVNGATDSVALAISDNPGGGTLSGTTAVAAADGVATFDQLSIDKAVNGYRLVATVRGLATAATSEAFDVTAAMAAELVFSVQPIGGIVSVPMLPAVEVTAYDSFGNSVKGFTDDVTVTLGVSPSGGMLSGTMTTAALGGVAIFGDLVINVRGSGYRLHATSGSLPVATSAPFDIIVPIWREIVASGPSPKARSEHTAVFSAVSNRMIVFGGNENLDADPDLRDVWVLTGANGSGERPAWIQLQPTFSLTGFRTRHAAVYDEDTRRMILHGGSTPSGVLSDDWLLVDADGIGTPGWQRFFPDAILSDRPISGGRYGHSAVYDANSNRMIVFGGRSGVAGDFRNDVAVLADANGIGTPTWQQLDPFGHLPAGRWLHSAIYDADSNRLVVFGGSSAQGVMHNDVWVLKNANGLGGIPIWERVSPAGAPPTGRSGHKAIYNQVSRRMLVFGGANGSVSFSDLWLLVESRVGGESLSWIQLAITSPLAGRVHHSIVYDRNLNTLTVFGGLADGLLANDVWVLNNANGLP
jgi:hypothetical protein